MQIYTKVPWPMDKDWRTFDTDNFSNSFHTKLIARRPHCLSLIGHAALASYNI